MAAAERVKTIPWWKAPTPAFFYPRARSGEVWPCRVLAYLATSRQLGLAIPMFVGTVAGVPGFIIALLLGPETKGKVLALDLVVA